MAMDILCPRGHGKEHHWRRSSDTTRRKRIWCYECAEWFQWLPPATEYATCPGCQEQVRPAGMRKHQQTDKCQAATLAAFAKACGYTDSPFDSGIPECLILRLRTEYRPMSWGHGGVRTDTWAPVWAVELNKSLMALQNDDGGWAYEEEERRKRETNAAARAELILQAGPDWMVKP